MSAYLFALGRTPAAVFILPVEESLPLQRTKERSDVFMKTSFLILLCKILRMAGKMVGKGSSLPGRIVLKLDPNILQKIKLPEEIVAVTGSNGKTSTVEMIAHVLQSNGKKVAYNKEGSNQIEGVTTFLLNDCTLGGRIKSDIILMESDERFARHTFRHFTPTHYVITNLYRDQMTRNGHPEWVYDIVGESIHEGTHLVLNADDPLVSCFGLGRKDVTWFGVDRLPFSTDRNTSLYNDGRYCPNCKARMTYDYFHYNHIGSYHCTRCDLHRNPTEYTVTDASLEDSYIVINGEYRIDLSFSGIYHFYNTLATFAICSLLGIPGEQIVASLNRYTMKSGRIVRFAAGEKEGTLLTSKHENSISYDQSIRVAVQDKRDTTVTVIVDAISRKYYTSETSWLWDIDFELLAADSVKQIILTGRYCNDLAVRFSYCGIAPEKIHVIEDIGEAVTYMKEQAPGYQYVITCFSDKDKFLEKVERRNEE